MSFLEELKNYTPTLESPKHKAKVETLLNSTDIPYSRENLDGHITGSAFVVNETMDKCFLIFHKKLQIWLQPGGHCDGNSDVEQTALRETEEETGLTQLKLIPGIFDINVHDIPKNVKNGKTEPAHFHHDIRYLIIANENEEICLQEEEVSDAKWFDLATARKLTPHINFTVMIDKIEQFKEEYQAKRKKRSHDIRP